MKEKQKLQTVRKSLQPKRRFQTIYRLRRFHSIQVFVHKSNQLHISRGMVVSVVVHYIKLCSESVSFQVQNQI